MEWPKDKAVCNGLLLLAVTVNVGGGCSVIETGVAQIFAFAAMQTFSVTVVGVVMGMGAV